MHLAKDRCQLIACELSHYGGEDAFIAHQSTASRNVPVACSLTASLTKIKSDLATILQRKPHTQELWFYTAKPVQQFNPTPGERPSDTNLALN